MRDADIRADAHFIADNANADRARLQMAALFIEALLDLADSLRKIAKNTDALTIR